MLALSALADLQKGLSSALESMGMMVGQFGYPQLVEAVSKESEKLFQGYSKAKPSKEDAYAAALAFMRGHLLDSQQKDLIASVLSEQIREQSGAKALGNQRFSALLAEYESDARRGELWRLTWYGLLSSYFAFDVKGSAEADRRGWEELRTMLERTWPLLDRESGNTLVPDWVKVMRQESALLTLEPANKYAHDFLEGNVETVQRLAADLGISQSSWFWHALVLGAVRSATAASDSVFRNLIPRLIQLIEERPVYRDEAVEEILIRYHACKGASQDEYLRDYVVRKDVWKNPKLKSAGIATAWNRVPDSVWQMVLGWVNERNLKDFFDILAARNKADEGRLAFWSKYMKQITWTRLVFGADTMVLKNSNAGIRDLIAREEGSYANLTKNKDVDAFMMGIGGHIIVEFSKAPNAAYVYHREAMKFDCDDRAYSGGTDDLKYGYYEYSKRDNNVLRITHFPGWQLDAGAQLKRLGIVPDTPGAQHVAASAVTRPSAAFLSKPSNIAVPAPSGAPLPLAHTIAASSSSSLSKPKFTMSELDILVKRFDRAVVDDRRSSIGGRLWVDDRNNSSHLASELKAFGFRWSNKRMAWYHVET